MQVTKTEPHGLLAQYLHDMDYCEKIKPKDFPEAFQRLKGYQGELDSAMTALWPSWSHSDRKGEEEVLEIYLPMEAGLRKRDIRWDRIFAARDKVRALQDQLIVSNMGLVVRRAQKYWANNLDYIDLVQEGALGLHRAVDKYDVDSGYAFSTYAVYWINQKIMRTIQDTDALVRVPTHLFVTVHRLLSGGVLTEKTMQSKSFKAARYQVGQTHTSIDAPVGKEPGGSESTSLKDFMEADTPTPEEDMLADVVYDIMNQKAYQNDLSERDLFILNRRFGFHDGHGWQLDEIGAELKITRERVRQLQNIALKKVRRILMTEGIEGV